MLWSTSKIFRLATNMGDMGLLQRSIDGWLADKPSFNVVPGVLHYVNELRLLQRSSIRKP